MLNKEEIDKLKKDIKFEKVFGKILTRNFDHYQKIINEDEKKRAQIKEAREFIKKAWKKI